MRNGLRTLAAIAIAMAMSLPAPHVSAESQSPIIVPGVQASAPPPPPPTTNPQPPGSPPKLDTFSDKMSRCLHFGSGAGLQAGARDAYSRACANN